MPWWQQVGATIASEFSDVPDLAEFVRVCLRLSIAVLLGAVLGYERERRDAAAGLRTHMLVALGAALFVLAPLQSGMQPADLSRVMQGLIAGIGFLGAGAIIKISDKEQVKGLTTAASIWTTAAIAMVAGLGREVTAVLATALALIILAVIPRIEARLQRSASRPAHDVCANPEADVPLPARLAHRE